MSEDVTPVTKKHRVYKYSGIWYAHCGQCPRTCTAMAWQSVIWGLEFHVREHRPGGSP